MKEERSIQKNACYVSLILTAILWLILILIFAFAPPFQKRERYLPIQMTLEMPVAIPVSEKPQKIKTPEKVEKMEKTERVEKESSASVAQRNTSQSEKKASASSTANASSASKSASASQQKSSSAQKNAKPAATSAASSSNVASGAPASQSSLGAKAQTQNASDAPQQADTHHASNDSKKADITYKKSVEELLEEQLEATKGVQWDEAAFANGSVNEAVSHSENANNNAAAGTEPANALDGKKALAGMAGEAADSGGGAVAKADSPSSQENQEASDKTMRALHRIASTTYTAPAENGVQSSVSVNAATDLEGVVSIEMTNKSTRILLDPKKPYIILSEENAALIDSSRKVVLEFAVLASGAVPFSRIDFIPSSLLPQAVQSEIREQISKWRFSAASTEATARFEYTIKKL